MVISTNCKKSFIDKCQCNWQFLLKNCVCVRLSRPFAINKISEVFAQAYFGNSFDLYPFMNRNGNNILITVEFTKTQLEIFKKPVGSLMRK